MMSMSMRSEADANLHDVDVESVPVPEGLSDGPRRRIRAKRCSAIFPLLKPVVLGLALAAASSAVIALLAARGGGSGRGTEAAGEASVESPGFEYETEVAYPGELADMRRPHSVPAAAGSGAGGRSAPPSWNEGWSDLTPDERIAAVTLGFDKEMWDHDTARPVACDFWWDDLAEGEREAAKVLGWDEDGWNSVKGSDAPVYDPEAQAMDPADLWQESWSSLTVSQQAAAIVLGFDQEVWDSGAHPSACNLWWDDLSSEQASQRLPTKEKDRP